MKKAAEKFSIISIGIACFNGDSKHGSIFQISCLPSDDLIINVDTAKFLVKHGFDFNKLVEKPVIYKKVNCGLFFFNLARFCSESALIHKI